MSRTRPDLPASLLALVVTVVGLAPLHLLVDGSGWVGTGLLTVLGVLLVGVLLRAAALPAVGVAFGQLVVTTLAAGAVTSSASGPMRMLPGPTWWRDAVAGVEGAVATIQQQAAPVDAVPGLLAVLVAGAGVVTLTVDGAANSRRHASLGGLPLVAVYATTAAVLPIDLVWTWFLAPAVGFLLLLGLESGRLTRSWTSATTGRSRGASGTGASGFARGGRVAAVLALTVAIAVPATLPTLGAGWFGAGSGGGGGRTIETDNPIVDLQRDLIRPENIDILRYRSENGEGTYIRSVTLDEFDGTVWKTSDRSVPQEQQANGALPQPPGLEASFPAVEYEIEVTDQYHSRWLPMPYPARAIAIDGDWRYDAATLDVVSPDADTQGASYVVSAVDVQPTRDDLAATSGSTPSEVLAQTEIPADVPDLVGDLADEVTEGAGSDYESAVALQSFFRSDGGFTYSLATDPGTATEDIVDFLENRIGYCEQYAASMAVMARSLGIPARVAVGFTPGRRTSDEDTWLVRSHDAHAWPELYFDGLGWIRFEPTPGQRTGLPPEWTVGESVDDPESEPTPTPTGSTDSTGAPVAPQLPEGEQPVTGGATTAGGVPPWAVGIGAALLLAGIVLGTPSAVAAALRRRRWRPVSEPGRAAAAAEAAWAEVGDAAEDAGITWPASESPRVRARRLHGAAELGGDDIDRLRHLVLSVERARYAREPIDQDTATLRSEAEQLRLGLLADLSRRRRLFVRWLPAPTRAVWRRLSGSRPAEPVSVQATGSRPA